jgi:hypothetical protein
MWDKESMVRAVKAVRDKEMGLLKASKMFTVPKASLKDYVNSRGEEVEHLVTMKMGRKPVLPAQIENELVNYCLLMEINFFRTNDKRHQKNGFSDSSNKQPATPIFYGKRKKGSLNFKMWIFSYTDD